MFVTLVTQAIRFGAVFLYGSAGEILVEKSGHLNLGIPGIMCIGAIGGCMGANLGWQAGMPNALIIIMAVLFAFLFGGLAGALYGFFTITLRCNQNVTGLTLTTFGAGALGFWGSAMAKAGTTFYKASKAFTTPMFGAGVGTDGFSTIFLSHGTLVYLAIVIAVVMAIILKKTRVGLSLAAIGENPAAADAAGINVIRYKYVACIVGAGIAGIGGAFYLLDCTRGSLEYVIDAMGWLAVALVIFSLWRPNIAIIGSFVFGLLYILPNYITGVDFADKELIKIVPYAVTALTLIIISFFNKKETQPPAALGLPYFREDR
ncbi:MAG: ABC transporter permease [Clostridia bacterium]|nr:ABC transporter permease [Clostridia bacterium]